jgi:hypothetical protein
MVDDASACVTPGTPYNPVHATPITCNDLPSCRSCTTAQTCSASIAYLDRTAAQGPVYTDNVIYDGQNTSRVFFAAITKQRGHFSTTLFDGIVGLSYPDGQNGVPDFLTSLNSFASVPAVFGLCLDEKGGYISFGGADTKKMVPGAVVEWMDVR